MARVALKSARHSAALHEALEAPDAGALCWPGWRATSGTGRAGARRLYAFAQPGAIGPTRARLAAHALHRIGHPSGPPGREAEEWYGADADSGALVHVRLRPVPPLLGDEPGEARAWPGGDAAEGEGPSRRAAAALLAWCDAALHPDGSAERPADAAVVRASVELAARRLGPAVAAALGDAFEGAELDALRLALIARGAGDADASTAPPRTAPAPVIAVIGCDGSGKSTVSRWLAEELDEPFGSRFIYFGTGDGPGSAVRRALVWLRRHSRFAYDRAVGSASPSPDAVGAERTARRAAAVETRSPEAEAGARPVPAALRLLWAAVVAHERLGKMRELRRATGAGLTVVTDRYPQTERAGIHDGPRLGRAERSPTAGVGARRSGASRALDALARAEHALYARLASRVPDRVLLLDVPLEVAVQRRPEERVAALERRIEIARSLRFGGARRVVIDASQPLARVKREALGHALEALAR